MWCSQSQWLPKSNNFDYKLFCASSCECRLYQKAIKQIESVLTSPACFQHEDLVKTKRRYQAPKSMSSLWRRCCCKWVSRCVLGRPADSVSTWHQLTGAECLFAFIRSRSRSSNSPPAPSSHQLISRNNMTTRGTEARLLPPRIFLMCYGWNKKEKPNADTHDKPADSVDG